MYLFPCVRKTVTLQSFMKQAIDSVPNEVTCEHSFLQKNNGSQNPNSLPACITR